jgi:predicted dehydrogenase/threonine dehydrogenase-like Zn-dependent dehydrogenase
MKQVLIHRGQVVIEDVPAPKVETGTVLVAVNHSCISAGTELSGIQAGAKPLWKRALEQPDKVKKVFNMMLTEGIDKTKNRIESAVSSEKPTGYSLAGTVLEVGDGIMDIHPGDAVACAGAQYAHHAEVVRVPRNLMTLLPEGLGFAEASTVTLGAIAMQGVRRLQPTLGECFVVIGLGILGQLTAQLLKANGCRVFGTDLDMNRVKLACLLGMDTGIDLANNQIEQTYRLTDGIGADGVIITAAAASSEIISTAFQMCRKKGRVVVVGDVGLDIKRSDIYQKELDFFISTSYGPGRYDQNYEEHGLDYPVSYVRWTENRNMAEYLRLVSQGRINVTKLISATYPLEDAHKAYADLQQNDNKLLIALLSYPGRQENFERRIEVSPSTQTTSGKIRVAVIGAGSFAQSTHLPNLQKFSGDYEIRAVCSRTGHNAKSAAKQFQSGYATTDYGQILADSDVDAVLIATRHNLHAEMALQALKAGKHVLVEKPFAINQVELDAIKSFYAAHQYAPVFLTGFNRRFSPHIRRIKEITDKRSNPMIINYRMNAGYIPLDHWVHGTEGGGRNIGEACHIYDLFTFLTDAKFTNVIAQSIHPKTGYYSARDNFICTVSFDDGSLATLTYTALGTKDYFKEKMEVYVDGQVLVMEDYKSVEVVGTQEKGIKTKVMDKGLEAELQAFAKTVKGVDASWPNPLWQQIQAMEIAFGVEGLINK